MNRHFVVERLPRRSEPQSPVPLPEPVALALAAITRDMRDVPRDCLRDPAELLHWLRRMANRVEGVATMKVPGPARPSRPPRPTAALRAAPTARQSAEAVFSTAPKACTAKGLRDETLRESTISATGKFPVAVRPVTRTVTSRKGRAVPVEIRRARAAGQMEFGL